MFESEFDQTYIVIIADPSVTFFAEKLDLVLTRGSTRGLI